MTKKLKANDIIFIKTLLLPIILTQIIGRTDEQESFIFSLSTQANKIMAKFSILNKAAFRCCYCCFICYLLFN